MINFNFSCDQRHLHCFNSINLPLLLPFPSFIPSFHSPLPSLSPLLFSSPASLRVIVGPDVRTNASTPALGSPASIQLALSTPLSAAPATLPLCVPSLSCLCLDGVSLSYPHSLSAQNIYAGCLPTVALAFPFALRPFVRRARCTPAVHPAALNLSLLDLAGIIVCRGLSLSIICYPPAPLESAAKTTAQKKIFFCFFFFP